MNTFNRFTIAGVLSLSGIGVVAQTESEALLFSRTDVLGTARYSSMGGAFTALGGDPSSSSKNPAGVAVYRNNEFSLTPAYHEHFSDGSYYGNTRQTGKSNFNIGSFSLTGVQELKQAGKWRNTALSFGINRISSFHRKYSIEGLGVNSSILDDYTATANRLRVDSNDLAALYPFDLYLLWANYLINNQPGESSLYMNNGGTFPLDQTYNVTATGAKRETYFNFGGNYDDKLYIGAGVAMSNISFERVSTYSEYFDANDTTTFIDEFSQTYYEEISGRGWSANIGAIYRPTDALRIGLSWKTPELVNLQYTFESDNVTVEEGIPYEVLSPSFIQEYQFRVTSPMQSTLGVAYTFRKFGLVSVEADYVDYQMMSMRGRTDSDPFTAENSAIKDLLKPTVNVRTGLEYRITSFVSARAGYAYYGNPYKKAVASNGSFQIYSLGGGYRNDDFFVDLAYQYKFSSDRFFLYDPSLVEAAKVEAVDHRIALTFGLKI